MTNLVTPPLINDPKMWTNGEAAGTRCKLGLHTESFITLDAVERRSRTNNKDIYFEGCTGGVVATLSQPLLRRTEKFPDSSSAHSSGQRSSHRQRRAAIGLCSLEAFQSANSSCCTQVQNMFKHNFPECQEKTSKKIIVHEGLLKMAQFQDKSESKKLMLMFKFLRKVYIKKK